MLRLLFCNTFNKGKTQALKGNIDFSYPQRWLHSVSWNPLVPVFAVRLPWQGRASRLWHLHGASPPACGALGWDRWAIFPYGAWSRAETPPEGIILLSPPCSGAQRRCSLSRLSLRGRAGPAPLPEGPWPRAGRPLAAQPADRREGKAGKHTAKAVKGLYKDPLFPALAEEATSNVRGRACGCILKMRWYKTHICFRNPLSVTGSFCGLWVFHCSLTDTQLCFLPWHMSCGITQPLRDSVSWAPLNWFKSFSLISSHCIPAKISDLCLNCAVVMRNSNPFKYIWETNGHGWGLIKHLLHTGENER